MCCFTLFMKKYVCVSVVQGLCTIPLTGPANEESVRLVTGLRRPIYKRKQCKSILSTQSVRSRTPQPRMTTMQLLSMAEVPTAHDYVETTPEDGEPGSRLEDHPRHTQMEDVADTDSVASVATVVAEAIPDDLAEEDDRESLWSVGVISRVPMMWRRRFLSITQEFEVASRSLACS